MFSAKTALYIEISEQVLVTTHMFSILTCNQAASVIRYIKIMSVLLSLEAIVFCIAHEPF